MTFVKPKILFNNALRDSQDGDDGTALASSTGSFADADDPKNLRGYVSLSADVASASTLIGCGIKFDTSGNRYVITDSSLLMRKLAESSGLPSMANMGASLIVGSYLYVIAASGALLLKVDLVNFVVDDYMSFSTTPLSLCVNDDETILYVGLNSAPGQIIPVNLSTFEQGSAITLNSGENYVISLAYLSDAIIAGCNLSPGKIVKVDEATQARVGVLTLNAGENLPHTLTIVGTEIIAGCWVAPGIIVKIDTSAPDPQRLGALTLNAGEDKIDSAYAIGTNIYLGCHTTAGIVVKCDASATPPTRTAALTLNAGENQVMALAYDGTSLLAGCNVAPGIVVQINPVAMTRTSALTLNANEDNINSFGLYSSSIYCVCNGNRYIVKVNPAPSPPTRTSALTVGTNGELQFRGMCIKGDFLYAGDGVSPANIVKFHIPTMTRYSSLALNSGENIVHALVVVGEYIFALCNTAPGIIVKIDPNTMTRMGALTLNAGEDNPICGVAYGANLYVACSTTNPGIIVKIDPTPAAPTRTSALTLNVNELWPKALVVYGTSLLVGIRNTAAGVKGSIVKMDPVAMTRTSAVVFNVGESDPTAIAMIGDNGYAGMNCSPAVIVKFDASAMTRTGACTFAAGENVINGMVTDGNILVASCNTSPGKLVQVNPVPANPVEVTTLTFATGYSYPYGIAFDGDKIYTVLTTTPGIMLEIDPYQYFSLYERLQDADVGDSFTVRAGLTCAQGSTTYPVFHIADNAKAPRFTGTVNTEHKIRAHMPNYLSDGSFESGALSPNWTTDGGWTINSTSPLEGTYDAKWDVAADKYLQQAGTVRLEKGVTKTVLFKAKALTGNPLAAVITVTAKNVSGTNLDSDQTGYQPTITTTATWFSFDVTPDFTTDNWYLRFAGDSTKKDTATGIEIDEVYIYDKLTVDNLIVHSHNWNGRGAIKVNGWRLSPLRSTAATDPNNKAEIANFTPDNADSFTQALTSNAYPVFEIVLPAVAGWTPEAGEIRISDTWTVPRYPQSFDPYETIEGGLRQFNFQFTNLAASLRTTTIEDLFKKLRDNETVDVIWNAEAPVLTEDTEQGKRAPYTPYRVDLPLALREKP